MSKIMTPKELSEHCAKAIDEVKKLFEDFSNAGSGKMIKRAMLLAYWVRTYVKYIRDEDKFVPQSIFSLKRGSIVRVEFGYRVGKELGGRHYAAVLDVDNSIYRNTVTVVPLGSIKESSAQDKYSVVLEDGIFGPIKKKVDALIADAQRTMAEAKAMDSEIEQAEPEKKAILKAVQRQKYDTTRSLINQGNEWIDEVEHMRLGSVAKVDQITTISKMRISQPLKKTHPLYGVRLSANDLDKIDERLKVLYFSK
ncbi:MAG: type II toxin-antitoxin system PemK/MazF family toxin [Oscillospiraceae bacterium]|nr:type II toxin-antitoxin system PemK/MazF family toxin [Oscillospiraceae bacterium]